MRQARAVDMLPGARLLTPEAEFFSLALATRSPLQHSARTNPKKNPMRRLGIAMGVKTDEMSFKTTRSVSDIGRTLQRVAADIKAEVDSIQSSSGALASFDDRVDIEVAMSGQSLIGPPWAVQVYVADEGESRAVLLVAVGDGGFTRAMGGARNTLSLSGSIKRRDTIAAALR